jgi:copper chaperone NosL
MQWFNGCVRLLFSIIILTAFTGILRAAPAEHVDPSERCPVCGMFVAKYDNWIVQVRLADDAVMFFDGVKDMMVFYHNPGKYGKATQEEVSEIWVKDYYSLQWLDGRQALYVTGSGVYGPMGKEFIPFSSREAAENFRQDHQGENILAFADISDDLVQSMRAGMKMRHDKK